MRYGLGEKDSVLIIDDDEQVSDVLSSVLESEGYEVQCCLAPQRAFDALADRAFGVILLDLRLGDFNGLEVFPRLRELAPNTPIFIITAHGDVDSAVEAFSIGASGYIRKPFQDGELKEQIGQAIEKSKLNARIHSLRANPRSDDIRDLIRSRDAAMEPLLRKIATAAQVTSNVVIFGESGTGKELVARALHRFGCRKAGPFIAFNCAALPENLIESELFGYARGAFTDAKENKPGLFVRANGGTLFIDEIGDAPFSIQTKLLRVIQEREVTPVGGTSPIKVDVRIIAATHKNLQEEVSAGRFRQDLFYRLHVIPLQVPALRERPRDILLLATVFASQLAQQMKSVFDGFTPTAERALEEHPWPGNVRELHNRIEHSMALNRGGRIPAHSLFPEKDFGLENEIPENQREPEASAPDSLSLPTFTEAKNSFERTYLERVLNAAKGNIAKAARLASKSRTEVYSLLRKHSLDPGTFKARGSDD